MEALGQCKFMEGRAKTSGGYGGANEVPLPGQRSSCSRDLPYVCIVVSVGYNKQYPATFKPSTLARREPLVTPIAHRSGAGACMAQGEARRVSGWRNAASYRFYETMYTLWVRIVAVSIA